MRGIHAPSRGVWQLTADINVACRLAVAGFDWLALDAQHGAIDRAALIEIARALGDDANVVVRVPGVDPVWIGAALDVGASAVIVPTITSVADVERAVEAASYPPRGLRSWGPLTDLWGGASPDPATANARVQCIPMIETRSALDDVDAIAAVEGVHALFIGPFDLSLSIGMSIDDLLAATDADAPIPRVLAAAARHGRTVVSFAGDPSRVPALRSFGIEAVAVATDLALLDLGIRDALA
jgi:4-hydroxy-2-oxoheptanedioate aldolase